MVKKSIMIAKRTDANHAEIVRAFRKLGCSVTDTHMVGHGFPDIMVGKNSKSAPVEIKDGSLPPSKKCLTPDEVKWHNEWQGSKFIVEDLTDVIALVRALEK